MEAQTIDKEIDSADPEISLFTGLTSQEAAGRLSKDGFNELPQAKPKDLIALLKQIFREPMFLLLAGSSAIYLVIGDFHEAIFLIASFVAILAITVFQENKTEHALEALKDLSSPRALVIRDGKQLRIPGREVVVGDILILIEGDRVPADAVVLRCTDLSVDESLLTGESAPVRKIAGNAAANIVRAGGEDLPFVYSGTLIVKGQGIAWTLAIGSHTEIGKIGKSLEALPEEETALHRETSSIVRVFATIGLLLCVLVVLIYAATRGGWVQAFLAGITLAMSLIPEEFPVVLTIFLALGAWRISREHVLTRRIPAIETLGAATVLCVDKTGTLTINRMKVRRLCVDGLIYEVPDQTQNLELPERFHDVVEYSILASQKDPFDPMERAFKELGQNFLAQTEHLHCDWSLRHEYPLTPSLLAVVHVWKSPRRAHFTIAAKGAPEAIAKLCRLTEQEQEAMRNQAGSLAKDGLRVLGVARAKYNKPQLPADQYQFNFDFLGLVGLSDPIRETVPAALHECETAGVRVIMITGDYPATAQAIARQIKLNSNERYLTGTDLETLDDRTLQQHVRETNIFARVLPEHKLRIVQALKQNYEVVAMTGDGVNDAPALKAANIGIAMGGRGTDVAREAAALVLLDDDFASIVSAIRLGRRIFDNLRKAMSYIFAIHVPIAGMALIPLVAKLPLVFGPVHILFLELIIDPACSIAFEAESEEADIMKRPPRHSSERMLKKSTIALSLLQGISVLAIVLAVFIIALFRGQGAEDARTLTFTTLVIANLSLILTNRSWSRTALESFRMPNRALWSIIAGTLTFLAIILYVPFFRSLFHFSILHPIDLLICLLAGTASIVWFEFLKVFHRR